MRAALPATVGSLIRRQVRTSFVRLRPYEVQGSIPKRFHGGETTKKTSTDSPFLSWSNEVHEGYLRRAIDLAVENVNTHGEGPFGAVIVDDKGNIISTSGNQVNRCKDPTAHAEVMAIRKACEALSDVQLEHCVLYSSCEPCPMCLGAIYWAEISLVVYAAAKEDAEQVGFMDKHIYQEVSRPPEKRCISFRRHLEEYGRTPFNTWVSRNRTSESF